MIETETVRGSGRGRGNGRERGIKREKECI